MLDQLVVSGGLLTQAGLPLDLGSVRDLPRAERRDGVDAAARVQPRDQERKGQIGQEVRQDASLPFLAATAALLLLTEVIRLQVGALVESNKNYRAVGMRSPNPVTQELHHPCSDGCRSWIPAERRLKRTAGSRFASLDGELDTAGTHR